MEFENENINPQQGNGYVQLQELSNSDYEIRDGEPHIIGWNVKDTKGGKLGEVDELIFDPQSRKVRYLVLNMDGNDQHLEDERRVLIPIGIAQLDTKEDEVILPNVTHLQLSDLPPYEGCPELTAELEMETRKVLEDNIGSAASYETPQFYAHDHFNENRFYSRGNLPENETIIPAENMDGADEAGSAEKGSRIVARINHKGQFSGDTKAQ